MDAIELLDRQHADADREFEEYEALGRAGERARRRQVARELVGDLTVHIALTEQTFLPTMLEALPELEEVIHEDLDQQRQVRALLSELQHLDPEESRFEALLRQAMEALRRHVEVERDRLFPSVRRAFSAVGLGDLGEAMEALASVWPREPDAVVELPATLIPGPAADALCRAREAAMQIRNMAFGPPTA